jgi:2-polyprenyl-6-methoxyphenol hydroxylase-like FAD-dependent oxidoreductase
VGDAGYWKDPIGAHGLTDALRDAELLARAITAVVAGDADERDALGDYHRIRDELSLPLFTVVDTVAGLDWTDEEIPLLLRRLAVAMSEEVDAIVGFDHQPALTLGEAR